MSAAKIRKLRRQSFTIQRHLCFYCSNPMWEEAQEDFARQHGIPRRLVKYLRCTAEHLVAQQDGGRLTVNNIVAVCLWCNQMRHRGRQHKAPDQTTYKSRVTKLVAKGAWHPVVASRSAR